MPGGEPLTSSPPFEPTDSHGPKPRTQRYPTQRPAGSNGPGHAPGVRVSSRGDGLPKDELYCTLRPLSRATRATSINPLMPSFRRAGWWRSSLARFFRGQVAPSLDHHGEHEPTDVVSPFGVLGRLIRPVVVNLGVEVRHRDAERCSLHERTHASSASPQTINQGRKSDLGVCRVGVRLRELVRLEPLFGTLSRPLFGTMPRRLSRWGSSPSMHGGHGGSRQWYEPQARNGSGSLTS